MRPPPDYIEISRQQYSELGYPPYQWVVNEDDPPFAPLRKPLSDSRLGLIGSGGVYVEGQVAFHSLSFAYLCPRPLHHTITRTVRTIANPRASRMAPTSREPHPTSSSSSLVGR